MSDVIERLRRWVSKGYIDASDIDAIRKEERHKIRDEVMAIPERKPMSTNVLSGYPPYWPFYVIHRDDVLAILDKKEDPGEEASS
jgi:hypothetical protein